MSFARRVAVTSTRLSSQRTAWGQRSNYVAKRQGWHCALCGEHLSTGPWNLDHIIPRGAGGTDELVNLQATHKSCNTNKGSRIPILTHAEILSMTDGRGLLTEKSHVGGRDAKATAGRRAS